jgi:hypothetical protein
VCQQAFSEIISGGAKSDQPVDSVQSGIEAIFAKYPIASA